MRPVLLKTLLSIVTLLFFRAVSKADLLVYETPLYVIVVNDVQFENEPDNILLT